MKVWAVYIRDLDGKWKFVSLWERESYAMYMADKYNNMYPETFYKAVPVEVESISLFDEEFEAWENERRQTTIA